MAKEQFFYPETQPLFKKLEQLSQRSSVSRDQAFQDWLTAMVCALAAETKEDEYLPMVERHKDGKHGRRGVDLMPQMFGELVNAMPRTDADILGDLFQGSITYGEAGQYFTLCQALHNVNHVEFRAMRSCMHMGRETLASWPSELRIIPGDDGDELCAF